MPAHFPTPQQDQTKKSRARQSDPEPGGRGLFYDADEKRPGDLLRQWDCALVCFPAAQR